MELKPLKNHAKPIYAIALSTLLSASLNGCQFGESPITDGVVPAPVDSAAMQLDGDVAVPSTNDDLMIVGVAPMSQESSNVELGGEVAIEDITTDDSQCAAPITMTDKYMDSALDNAVQALFDTDIPMESVNLIRGLVFTIGEYEFYVNEIEYQDKHLYLTFYSNDCETTCKDVLEQVECLVQEGKAKRLESGYIIEECDQKLLLINAEATDDFSPAFFSALYDEAGL